MVARIRSASIAFALAAVSIPAGLHAQAYQCALPDVVRVPDVARDGEVRRSPITGYTFALSWSPEFCRFREGDRTRARQCSGRSGRFGFTVHGLWPDSGRGWPQWCAPSEPPAAALQPNRCISPDMHLLARQWAKHGSCMVRKPRTYYRVTRILYAGLQWPDFVRLSREDDLNAGMVRERFADANPGWFENAIGVHLNERGWLQELRLCYDTRFMPIACDARRIGAKDAAPVKIWRGL
ncbi:ribonuclease T [Erythrobacter litoralis]|uniref:ribonuclease T2 family protein n=1 Tax=Erythrobacter litoralis TaxID=39960 RepID=UPI0024347DDF|nr:ribonuclease T [Erythrobacter litoralis]MDG6079478.1 ribonuclease T [Erythrobacter litoralis]